ncbi:centrosomal protein cep290 isoform X2 [Drosophila miranda]|uniref:centrosomal protein cep290 isoform X2 n=1 Tax=Drosophila miranda TaxID=7229 RepID=UPI0007E7F019|nr:centrosomal protein cep290 isoform X2 [Drosophila miranda]
MDIPETVSVRKFREFTARQKQELYETLLELAETLEELPRKSLRKTLELTLAVLEYKGEQAAQRLEQGGSGGRLQGENEKLKRMLQRLEDERDGLKSKTKELGEEIRQLELRLREAAQQAEASDKDSSDPLSELDKQDTLLQNIDAKNKHIKRLLKEIETLQNQNISQSKTIVVQERELQNIKTNLLQLSDDITEVEQQRKSLMEKEQQQCLEITRLEGNVTFLEVEREKHESEMRQFLEKYETQCLSWKKAMHDKEKEVERLTKQLATGRNTLVASTKISHSKQDEEQMQLRNILETREKHIEKLEARLKSMAEEMISSTKVMKKLTAERERFQNPEQPRACCQMIEERLAVTQARVQQLSEMLDASEQDNVVKCKQAMHALSALESYKRGEDGLLPALRHSSSLEQKLAEREKQLRSYVQELNSLNEVMQENELLRRRLNIPEDVVVLAKNTRAKQRNKDKQIERLMLKLRTSEELRLQLKLEKSELRRKLLELNRGEPLVLDDVLRQVSEVGELPSSTPLEKSPRRGQGDGAASTEMQSRYDEVLAENETLRMGMYEILEKLREYDDSELLRRLIEALPSGISTAQNLQGQLLELKAREEALRQLLLQQNGSDSETGELSSVQSLCDVPEMPEEEHEEEHQEEHPEEHPKEQDEALPAINTATRPSTPTEATIGLQRPIITNMEEAPKSEQLLELSLLRKHYEELRLHMSADGNQLLNHNQQLHEQVLSLELQLEKNSSSYGYMRQEYDQLLTESRRQELRFIEDKSVLMRQLEQTQAELSAARDQLEDVHRRHLYTAEEHQQLEQRNAILCMQLGQATEQLLGELKLPDICAEYGIIGDNYQLDYVTAKEYEQQRQELASWRGKQAELQRETKQLEGLLSVANGQIHSQQKLLNDITDNHINLRHLVADLQSSSNEKLMLAKVQRDLDSVKAEVSRLEAEREQIQLKADGLQSQLEATERSMAQAQQDFQLDRSNSEIKQKFLQHSLFALKEKYAKFTPLIFLTNFVFAYHKFQQRLVEHHQQQKADHSAAIREALESVQSKVTPQEDSSKQLIKLIKSETQSRLLEQRCESLQTKLEEVQRELSELRVRQSTDSEHWQTIHALFGEQGTGETTPRATVEAATNTGTADPATNTEAEVAPVPAMRRAAQLIDRQSSPIGSPRRRHPHSDTSTQTQEPVKLLETAVQTNGIRTQQHQSVQTSGEGRRGSREDLQQMQASLLEANERCELLRKQLEASKAESREPESPHSGVVEKTILSFHTLLLEKDKSIQKFQDLLQTEREQSQQLISKQTAENESLRSTVNNLNFNIKTKDVEIMELRNKLEQRPEQPVAVDSASAEPSVHDLTDEKIEEMFEDSREASPERPAEEEAIDEDDEVMVVEVPDHEPEGEQEKQDTEELKELPTLHKQIKELKDKLEYTQKIMKTKEEKVKKLKDKLKVCQKNEKTLESQINPELDQLRGFIAEKDRHIKELLETMQHFHEDQQRYIKDSSHYSEEQMGKLAADLSRTKATNKIYHTQVEALRRQLTIISQREKQARELTQSLRQQLVKRPVASIKTELNARVKNENQQKRIQQLEAELDETRDQMQRQQRILETKRTRSANEVGLWEKQKRWQQQADKYKAKLEETEMALEKSRALLQAARTTITRLEKDKHLLETKVARGGPTSAPNNPLKCCRTPSCPNLQHVGVNKFSCSPSESPEPYTGPSSECSSPAHHPQPRDNHDLYDRSQLDLIEALKNRIELQQRKIIAMELEGRGSNALTTELEKLQERFQGVEAQNIRMEARNLQLQLESDLLRQNDSTDRLQKRIKHLEDYIIALKEEMARNESRRELCKCSGLKVNTQQGQSAEHTILSLRNLVEKLRSENKFLKDGRRSSESRISVDSSATPLDVAQWQQQHAESMQKISGLQQELQKRTKCSQCSGRSKDATNGELKFIKEQLTKKTQLLEKAKILLTRAAAKEKVLREQLVMWKRKCSELANVPVIDEISE